ncbi:MAG TPA: acyl-CoA dehydrogenase family protein [Candidatus Binatia bacterium]
MDLRLTDEEKLISRTAARFVDKELIAREGDYLKQAELFLPPGDPPRRTLDGETRAVLEQGARGVGLWALELPETAGGSAMNAVAQVLIYREFGRTILPFEPACIPALMGESQYADQLGAGKLSISLAFEQVHKTGSLNGIETRFRPTADGFRLSNTTIHVLDPDADLFLFPVREDGANRFGLFALEQSTTGLSLSGAGDLTTDGAVAVLTLHECEIPSAQLLGYEYEVAALIAAQQLRIAARSLGIATRCLADSTEYARNRVTFGRPLASRQAVQWMLADLSIALRSSTWLTLEAAWQADRELPYFRAAALAKKRAAKMAFEAADTAIQIHGGYGVCKELPFEGFYREARLLRLLYGREGEMDRAVGERFLSAE